MNNLLEVARVWGLMFFPFKIGTLLIKIYPYCCNISHFVEPYTLICNFYNMRVDFYFSRV